MKMADVIRVCKAACPADIAWTPHELYGEYNIEDYNKQVKKVLYCVTPTPQVVEHFKKHGYDLLISHHPFKVSVPQLIFHTALDCCEGGLNDQWRDHLGLLAPYQHFDGTLGWHGEIKPTPFSELCKKVSVLSGSIDGEAYAPRPDFMVKTVVICSGLGGLVTEQALATNADCYVIGENIGPASMSGFRCVIETGHTNSEWMGVLLFQKILRGVQVDAAPRDLDHFGREHYLNKAAASRIIEPPRADVEYDWSWVDDPTVPNLSSSWDDEEDWFWVEDLTVTDDLKMTVRFLEKGTVTVDFATDILPYFPRLTELKDPALFVKAQKMGTRVAWEDLDLEISAEDLYEASLDQR